MWHWSDLAGFAVFGVLFGLLTGLHLAYHARDLEATQIEQALKVCVHNGGLRAMELDGDTYCQNGAKFEQGASQ